MTVDQIVFGPEYWEPTEKRPATAVSPGPPGEAASPPPARSKRREPADSWKGYPFPSPETRADLAAWLELGRFLHRRYGSLLGSPPSYVINQAWRVTGLHTRGLVRDRLLAAYFVASLPPRKREAVLRSCGTITALVEWCRIYGLDESRRGAS